MAEKLMPLHKWRKERFTTPPAAATARRWAENGDIPAKLICGKWYVKVEQELLETGDDLVDQVLKAG
ncbi:excisionase [Marinobacterium lutimaris]|uniref:Excisionase-like protein n=1 Tax=Marinobacterium lutimaris TaxID=568106 RepID=A0A1H5YDA2_9GAMM|nr:excisionase [Marinobacterium lutimaris]SEG21998.1 Excisionase-like protein [Marinobacterium lutimaris]